MVAVGLSISIRQRCWGGLAERWRRTRASQKLHKARHPAMAVHYLAYLIKPARVSIFVAMLVPSSWNAATAARATRAAATAYSDSSSPVSSCQNFLNIDPVLHQRIEGLNLQFQPAASLPLPGRLKSRPT